MWRSASSGGRATRQAARGDSVVSHVGDLIPVMAPANAFFDVFAVECKRVRTLQWRQLFDSHKGCNIRDFWKQARDQGTPANKLPFLMMREDNGVDLVAIRADTCSRLLRPIVTIENILSLVRTEALFNGVSSEELLSASEHYDD